ncbi:hypothetical protein BD769DRAFT_1457468, partial [Suillus cothurnatus]
MLPAHLLHGEQFEACGVRRGLFVSGFYTGDPLLMNRVKWRFGDHRDILVRTTEPVEHAVLSTIVSISTSEFHLTADGDWEGPTSEAQSVADAEATCMGEAPCADPLKHDFLTTIENLSALQELAAAIPDSERVGVMSGQGWNPTGTTLTFRHQLFRHRARDEDYANLADWPVYTYTAREALDALGYTHYAVPITAYDFEGYTVPPNTYEQHFRGALAQIDFTLAHDVVEEKDVYRASIRSMRVLRHP